jgi:hypothetical protein
MKLGCGVPLALLGLFVVLAVLGSVFGDDNDESGEGGGDASVYVRIACEGWVKERLKAPATAEFADSNVTSASGVYTVRGAVDSQNSFGALIRSRFTCVATHDGEATRLVDLTVQ